MLPALGVSLLLTLYPIGSVLWSSLTADTESGTRFAGFANYVSLFRTPRFGDIVLNTVIWTVATTAGALVVGIIAAIALQHKMILLRGAWRSVLLLPWIAPQVASATIWKWLYSSDFGMLNQTLIQLHILAKPISWLSRADTVLPVLVLVQIWGTFPFVMLMVSAGLQTIDESVLEAARLDGANRRQELFYFVLPALRNVLFIVSLIVIVWALNSFATIWVITQGGPAGHSSIFSIYIYESFRSFDLHRSAAASVLLLIASFTFAAAYVLRIRKGDR